MTALLQLPRTRPFCPSCLHHAEGNGLGSVESWAIYSSRCWGSLGSPFPLWAFVAKSAERAFSSRAGAGFLGFKVLRFRILGVGWGWAGRLRPHSPSAAVTVTHPFSFAFHPCSQGSCWDTENSCGFWVRATAVAGAECVCEFSRLLLGSRGPDLLGLIPGRGGGAPQ